MHLFREGCTKLKNTPGENSIPNPVRGNDVINNLQYLLSVACALDVGSNGPGLEIFPRFPGCHHFECVVRIFPGDEP